MSIKTFQDQWFYIAGHSPNIKSNSDLPDWRFALKSRTFEQYPLYGGPVVIGESNSKNHIYGKNPHAENGMFLAWVQYFGDGEYNSETKKLIVTLKPAP